MVTVTCSAGPGALIILDGEPAAVQGQPAELQFNATEKDDGRSFVCEATLDVDGEAMRKNASAQLRVLCELASSSLLVRDLQESCPGRVEQGLITLGR